VIYIIIKLAANNLAVCQLCSEKALKEVLVQMEKLVEVVGSPASLTLLGSIFLFLSAS